MNERDDCVQDRKRSIYRGWDNKVGREERYAPNKATDFNATQKKKGNNETPPTI